MIERGWARLNGSMTRLLTLLVSGWMALALPHGTAAQTTQLSQLQLQYDGAKQQLEAHRANWAAQQEAWQATLDSVNLAQRSGDRGRLDAADRQSTLAAIELARLDALVKAAERDLTSKRRAFEDAIERQINTFSSRARSAPASERQALNAQITSLGAQFESLRAEESSGPQPLLYLPQFAGEGVDPRMSIRQINDMLGLIDRRVAEYQSEIDRIDAEVKRLTTVLERRRAERDRERALGRFGTDQPVGANRPGSSGEDVAVTVSADPQAQIDAYKIRRTLLNDMIRQLEVRVANIKRDRPGVGAPQ